MPRESVGPFETRRVVERYPVNIVDQRVGAGLGVGGGFKATFKIPILTSQKARR